ncbi:MAG TPA: hypothetical protein VMW10_12605, partial [Alphaproteobacteria bacterium]|nr:hypothetical protein [Alphaproteobacteria bacterium]
MKKQYFSYKIVSLTALSMASFSDGYAGPGEKPSIFSRDTGCFEEEITQRKTCSIVRLRRSTPLSRSYGTWGVGNHLMAKRPTRYTLLTASALGTLGAVIGVGAYHKSREHEEPELVEDTPTKSSEAYETKKYSYFFQRKRDKTARGWNFSSVYADSSDSGENPKQQAAPGT